MQSENQFLLVNEVKQVKTHFPIHTQLLYVQGNIKQDFCLHIGECGADSNQPVMQKYKSYCFYFIFTLLDILFKIIFYFALPHALCKVKR